MGGTHQVSAVGWFHTGLCPFWSRRRRRELGISAAAWSGMGRAWQLPQHSCRDGGWRGGLASRSATWVLSPEESQELLGQWAALSGHAWPVLHRQLGAPCSASIWVPSCTPGCWGREHGPSLLCPCIALLSCQGLSQTTCPTFLTLELLWEQVGSLQLLPSCLAGRANDFQVMADLQLSELANEHGENELFRLT